MKNGYLYTFSAEPFRLMTEQSHLLSEAPYKQPAAATPRWSWSSFLVFRYLFSYVAFFLWSFSGFFAPLTLPLSFTSNAFWSAVIPWIATQVLQEPAPALYSDGDGLGQWIQVFGCGVLALISTLIWSICDRRRQNYDKLYAWLHLTLRYAVGIVMFFYGLAKVFHLQMLPPHLAKLIQPYGDSSPTSLLWIMLGSSAAYSAFTGLVEVLGGVLLFNRRTTTLGALISFGAMVHVLVLNMSYDVSVKIWSMNWMAFAALLLATDFRRLVDVFVLNRPTEKVAFPVLFKSAKSKRGWGVAGLVCLAITLGIKLLGLASGYNRSYRQTPVALYGIYEVESFTLNETRLPPLLTDEQRWKALVIERSGLASVLGMNGDPEDFLTRIDAENRTVSFLPNPDQTQTAAGATRLAYDPRIIQKRYRRAVESGSGTEEVLSFTQSSGNRLTLAGPWQGESIEVQL
ncbi:MAG: hypothetical protein KJT03_20800, partial [Verrucomicrobiae bacterium]|nr:hypothetical protein [Verrucomicrobiae bacterium]